MNQGTIFHNQNFKFHDGTVGNKILILLNNPCNNNNCLFLKTTSQKKDKPPDTGCFKHRNSGIFFLPQNTSFFTKDTWILLHEIYEIKLCDVNEKKGWHKIGRLPDAIIKKIIDCLFIHHDDDISELHESWLRPPITASLQSLKEKFNNSRN